MQGLLLLRQITNHRQRENRVMDIPKGMKRFREGVLAGNLLSLSLVTQPGALVKYLSECAFLYRSTADNRGVPQKHVFEAMGQDSDLEIRLPKPLEGNKWFNEMPFLAVDILSLCLLCRFLQPRRIFEIGTFDGYSTTAMAMNSPGDSVVYSLDLSRKGTRRMTWEGTSLGGKIVQLTGDSASFDFSPYRGNIDLFYVDGAHSYEYARCDTANALVCTHQGSIIAWHDFGKLGCLGVERAARELLEGQQIFAVPGGSLAYARM